MTQSGIVVVGSINMDLVVRAPRHPLPGETILGSSFATFPGGKGANQAVAAARLGLPGQVRMVGRVGADAFGDSLLATLQGDGIDTRFVWRTEDVSSGLALITVSDAGQNNIVVVPGANGRLTQGDVQNAEAAFIGAGVVLLQLEIPLETAAAAAQMARKHGARVVLNPAPACQLPEALLDGVDVLVPNEHELSLLTGCTVLTQAAHQLVSERRDLVITLGSQGVWGVTAREDWRIAAYGVRVVDTTAAGDAFVGGLAVALTEGKTLRDAAVFGNAAGALAVTQAGAQPSLPNRAALNAFLTAQEGASMEDSAV